MNISIPNRSYTKKFAHFLKFLNFCKTLFVSGIRQLEARANVGKINIHISRTRSARWCWELRGTDGYVYGRSNLEFNKLEQAIASAQLVQWSSTNSFLVNHDGEIIG